MVHEDPATEAGRRQAAVRELRDEVSDFRTRYHGVDKAQHLLDAWLQSSNHIQNWLNDQGKAPGGGKPIDPMGGANLALGAERTRKANARAIPDIGFLMQWGMHHGMDIRGLYNEVYGEGKAPDVQGSSTGQRTGPAGGNSTNPRDPIVAKPASAVSPAVAAVAHALFIRKHSDVTSSMFQGAQATGEAAVAGSPEGEADKAVQDAHALADAADIRAGREPYTYQPRTSPPPLNMGGGDLGGIHDH